MQSKASSGLCSANVSAKASALQVFELKCQPNVDASVAKANVKAKANGANSGDGLNNWATDADVASLLAVNIKFANGDRRVQGEMQNKQFFDITPTYPHTHTRYEQLNAFRSKSMSHTHTYAYMRGVQERESSLERAQLESSKCLHSSWGAAA